MSKEIITKPAREEFIKWINERLIGLGFSNDNSFWRSERNIQTPTQTIVINGQRVDRPGETRRIVFQVELFGDGIMKDVESGTEDPFIELNFSVDEGNGMEDVGPTFCLYYDDQLLFNNVISEIFRL